jgi:ADP-heptose:LPS heptosyltransferase
MLYHLLTLLLAPLLRLRIVLARRPPGPRRVLLIQTAKIGDLICTTPVIASLKTSWPDCHLTLLVNPVCAPLLAHDPDVDALWPVPAREWQGLAGKWRLLGRLRAARFDDCIVLSPNTAFLLLPLWAGIPRRAAILSNFPARSLDRCARFLSHGERHQGGRLLLDTELALLSALGCERLTTRKRLHAAPEAAVPVASFLAGRSAPRIGIGISSGNKLKALSAEQLSELCGQLLARLRHDLVLIGTAEDKPVVEHIRKQWGKERILDAAGAFGLDALPALMAGLEVYFGVDSGITYLADACDVPVVDLMGPASADDQRPTGPRCLVLRSALPCAPCSFAFRAPYACAIGTRACIAEADLQPIIAGIVSLAAAGRSGGNPGAAAPAADPPGR